MATSKPKKRAPADVAALQSEVASFASSLGLAPPHLSSSSGFDDSDFLKSGPIKPPKNPKPPKTLESNPKTKTNPNPNPKPQPISKPHPLQVDPFPAHSQSKNLPDLPLMKASSLSGQWYVDADKLEIKVLGEEGRKKLASVKGVAELKGLVAKKKELGERLMEQYTKEYEAARKKSGDMRLLEMTTKSGTSSDKVSAFTCLVEDNPIANLRSLDALLAMITSKVGKRYAFTGFEALKELFLLRLLPDRKLKCLIQRPLDALPETKDGLSLLLFWHWEECLKQRYEHFIIALEDALKDMLPSLKDKAMKTVFILLKSKSEQERRLLSAIVNKLGDPDRKSASGAGYQLSCLLSAHPNMKAVVIEEVDSFIFRPHIGLRAKYQAVNFLNQILLSKRGDGPKIAKRLLDVYFALFKVLMSEAHDGNKHKDSKNDKQKGKNNKKYGKNESNKNHPPESPIEMDSRLLSALLIGVNRAFPFVSSDEADDIIEVQTPILFRLVHSENFNVGVQALMLLYQISSKNQIASDRFYRALYAKLLTPAAVNSSKPEMFLGLLVKAMKNDINLKRVSAFAKRLLQVALQRPPQYACGCIFLLSEVLKAKPPLWTVVLQRESVDDELEHFEDITEEDTEKIGNPLSSNSLNSVRLVASQDDGKKFSSNQKVDCNDDNEDSLNEELREKSMTNGNIEKSQAPHDGSTLPAGYDPRHREPSYCNADRASWWELAVFASHVHPSVATMAQTLLSGANIVYNGDPLSDLSLNAFLDKFMEKKPKLNKKIEGKWHGGSQIAPAKKLDMNHHLIGQEILELAEEDVPPEDIVFHRFYVNKTGSSKRLKPKKKKALKEDDEDDAEDLLMDMSDDEGDEEEIDDMLGAGHLPLGGEGKEYHDYDDLDTVMDEDDEDLLGNGSDAETSEPSSKHSDSGNDDSDDDGEDLDMMLGSDGDEDIPESDFVGSDDSEGGESGKTQSKKKRKSRPSPFASLEEYEHMMTDDKKISRRKTKMPKKKKSKKLTKA